MSAMTKHDLDAALLEIGRISAADPAQCLRLVHQLKKFAPDLVAMIEVGDQSRKASAPFPSLSSITALECAIFDNWIAHGGKRPKKGQKGRNAVRLKAVLKTWIIPAPSINFQNQRQWRKFEVHLLDGSELAVKANKVKRSNPDLSTALADLSGMSSEYWVAGIPFSKPHGSGTIYHLDYLFMLRMGDDEFDGVLANIPDQKSLILPPFSARDAAKRPLIGNVAWQSRHSPDLILSNWITGKSLLISKQNIP